MTGGDSMDAISLEEWELLPDLGSSFFMEECTAAGGDEEEAMEPPVQAASAQQQQHAVEFKDIGAVQAEPRRGELASKVTEVMVSDDAEEEEEIVKSPAAEEETCEEDEVMVEAAPDHDHLGDEGGEGDHLGDEGGEGVEGDGAGVEGVVGFSVGKLRVNGVGALCSFGVAAATFCILVLGGRPQQQRKAQDHKSQFQVYADDERIHRAVEQASRLNQAVSSVMGGASTRATVSFGGYYNGF